MRGVLTIIGIVSVVIVVGTIFVLESGEIIQVRASNQIEVWDQNASYRRHDVIGYLKAGEQAEVTRCVGTKSDVWLEVRLKTGAIGLITGGPLILKRRKVSKNDLIKIGRIVFSCSGVFRPISEPLKE